MRPQKPLPPPSITPSQLSRKTSARCLPLPGCHLSHRKPCHALGLLLMATACNEKLGSECASLLSTPLFLLPSPPGTGRGFADIEASGR